MEFHKRVGLYVLFVPTQVADPCSHPNLRIFGKNCAYQRDYTLLFQSLICALRTDLYFMVSYLFPAIFFHRLPLQLTVLSPYLPSSPAVN